MTTTTDLGTIDLRGQVLDYISALDPGTYTDEFVDTVVDDIRAAINKNLDGTGISLHGDHYYGPYHADRDEQRQSIENAQDDVDFGEIFERHDPQDDDPQESGTVQVHEDNSGGVYLTRDGKTWGLGDGAWLAGNGSMGNSTAMADASGWANGDWQPSEQDGHTPSTTDNLTLVATWKPCDCDCTTGDLRIVRDDNGEFVGGVGASRYCGVQD